MVLALSLFEKLSASWTFYLALFSPGLAPFVANRATNITLDGREPVRLEVVKMTFIVPKGGLEEASL